MLRALSDNRARGDKSDRLGNRRSGVKTVLFLL